MIQKRLAEKSNELVVPDVVPAGEQSKDPNQKEDYSGVLDAIRRKAFAQEGMTT